MPAAFVTGLILGFVLWVLGKLWPDDSEDRRREETRRYEEAKRIRKARRDAYKHRWD